MALSLKPSTYDLGKQLPPTLWGSELLLRHSGILKVHPWTHMIYIYIVMTTVPETNMTPENVPSHMESSIPTIHFQVLRVC